MSIFLFHNYCLHHPSPHSYLKSLTKFISFSTDNVWLSLHFYHVIPPLKSLSGTLFPSALYLQVSIQFYRSSLLWYYHTYVGGRGALETVIQEVKRFIFSATSPIKPLKHCLKVLFSRLSYYSTEWYHIRESFINTS